MKKKVMPIIDPAVCKHPPARYWTGIALNEKGDTVLWVACCGCGTYLGEKILKRGKQ